MITAHILFAALSGAFGRFIKGGYIKWLPTWVAYVVFTPLGIALCWHQGAWAAILVSMVAAAGWNPGWGSYADAGASPSRDDEDVRFIVAPIAKMLGVKDERNVFYDALGNAVRYGLATILTALVMLACNNWLGSDFGLWYAAVGFLAWPMTVVGAKVTADVQKRWTAFELFLGAVIYGALAVAS